MTEEKKYKIVHEKKICIGCWGCANVTPEYWEMEEGEDFEMKSKIIGCKKIGDLEELELDKDLDKNMEAAEVCPVNCIHIEIDGERKI